MQLIVGVILILGADNIELFEIWYWDFDNIEQILESRLLKQSA